MFTAILSWRKHPQTLEEFRTDDDEFHATGEYLGLSFNYIGSCSVWQEETSSFRDEPVLNWSH